MTIRFVYRIISLFISRFANRHCTQLLHNNTAKNFKVYDFENYIKKKLIWSIILMIFEIIISFVN